MFRIIFYAVVFFIVSFVLRTIINFFIKNNKTVFQRKTKPETKPKYDKSKIVDAEFEEIK